MTNLRQLILVFFRSFLAIVFCPVVAKVKQSGSTSSRTVGADATPRDGEVETTISGDIDFPCFKKNEVF
ncbi:MAG: hypothetical protein JSW47_01510 [Phycisphaerales bacterium]|nr:MAG: hypothetical protein JSW47_01510 [Phycisphaerales bacterium]